MSYDRLRIRKGMLECWPGKGGRSGNDAGGYRKMQRGRRKRGLRDCLLSVLGVCRVCCASCGELLALCAGTRKGERECGSGCGCGKVIVKSEEWVVDLDLMMSDKKQSGKKWLSEKEMILANSRSGWDEGGRKTEPGLRAVGSNRMLKSCCYRTAWWVRVQTERSKAV